MTEIEKAQESDETIYANCMGEIRTRLLLIGKPHVEYLDGIFYIEFMCLQMRKICELFAFSTLTINRERYEKVHADFQQHWNYKKILRAVEKVNQKYFPEATTPIMNEETGVYDRFEGTAGKNIKYLTKEDITNIYEECCDYVHAQNHYKDLASFYPRTLDALLAWKEKLIEWRDEFIKLLDCHLVGLTDENGTKVFITFMYIGDENKKISVIAMKME